MVGIHTVICSHLHLSFNTSSTTGTTESKTLGNQHETPPWRVPWKHSFTEQIIPQFQCAKCCLRPRGQVEKWQKVYHKGSLELTGKKNKHADIRVWNRCCAAGIIMWPEITQTQRNQSAFWERGVDVGKIHRGCPTQTNYVPQRSLWHISGLSDDHFTAPFVKFVIDWPRESEQVVCFKGLLRSLLPEKGEQNVGYRDVELGQHCGEKEEKKWGESTGG